MLQFLHYRMAPERLQPNHAEFLAAAISLPEFRGGLGGLRGEAEFIAGRQGLNYLGLDPHLVQGYRAQYEESNWREFTAGKARGNEIMKLSSSISLAFLLRSEEEACRFFHCIRRLQRHH